MIPAQRPGPLELTGLTPEQVQWVAHLARLQIDEADLAVMARQLTGILDYVILLQQVPTDGIEPLAHPLPVQIVFRDDVLAASLPPSAALANAPDRRGDFFGVPAVLE